MTEFWQNLAHLVRLCLCQFPVQSWGTILIFPDSDKMKFRIFPLLLIFAFFAETAPALEYVRFTHNGKERNEEGRILFRASGGFAFEARDGRRYVITREHLINRRSDELPFVPYTKKEMIERLKEEFPPGEYYYLDSYGPFIIVYTTSKAFAMWYGTLLERLHDMYVRHWKLLGVELTKPEFPLVAIVLSNEERYRNYAKQEGENLFPEQRAYYHKLTNRIVMYDMTGQQAFREGNQRQTTVFDIRRLLAQPGAYNNIMTVIHEAAHQVGFNTGMHPRNAPNPTWVHEGLALLHEVPDSRHSSGWSLGPYVNRPRMMQLQRYLRQPHQESPIQKMIQDDTLFRHSETALDNYALAWGLTYYLVSKRKRELAAYLKLLQAKTIMSRDTGDVRIKDFEDCFGSDWQKFDKDFLDFVWGLR